MVGFNMSIFPDSVESPSLPIECYWRLQSPVSFTTTMTTMVNILKPTIKILDPFEMYDKSSGIFTIPKDGLYQIYISHAHHCPTTQLLVCTGLFKNKQCLTKINTGTAAANYPAENSFQVVDHFFKNDQVAVSIFSETSGHANYTTIINNGIFNITKLR